MTVLLLAEFSIQPLTFGPDRRIHDPAVYRLEDSGYLPGDWYTDMAVKSGVYVFYAKLIHMGDVMHVSEENWRQLLYIVSLIVLYYSMIRIARIFSRSFLVVPMVFALHALLVTSIPPIWLYGPFMQIDGGLAPRSIGMALSFLALFFLLKNARVLPWALLGVSTLIHVSNSFIVFTLFFGVWFCYEWLWSEVSGKERWVDLVRRSIAAISIYLVAGGWFAFFVAMQGGGAAGSFSADKFIWTWVYFRAPYMALPLMPWKSWLLFFFHCLAIVIGWFLLRKWGDERNRKASDFLGLVGLGAIAYFFLFYFFAFVHPWIPGFQFYSIRVVYFAYFVAYVFISLSAITAYQAVSARLRPEIRIWQHIITLILFSLVAYTVLFFSAPGKEFMRRTPVSLRATWVRLHDTEMKPPQSATARYLFCHPQPFLAPPIWYGPPQYLPNVASFKSFGFTPEGSVEWFNRINDVSQGELERVYEAQVRTGTFSAVSIDWATVYSSLTTEQIIVLSNKYHFKLFLTYKKQTYPFPIIAEDDDFRLYHISE